MRNKRLGCLSGTGILAALITTLAIAGYAYARGGLMYNPGPLNAQAGERLGGVTSHAETGGECKACHVAPWGSATMADRCTACHTNVARQMRDAASLHGALLHKDPNLGCRHCHPEHRGPQASLTVMESTSAFPHEAVGFSLKGHQTAAGGAPFACADCHPADITTFALDSCDSCHRQIDTAFMSDHTQAYGAACLDCHDGVDRFARQNFDHNVSSFKLAGKHVALACPQCHVQAQRLADFQAARPDCSSCHQKDDAHAGRLGQDCGQCHTTAGWPSATFDHNLAAFKLDGKHTQVRCEACHVNKQLQGTPTDCYSCHKRDDQHKGEYGTDCAACHNTSDWEDSDFDHNKTKFPLVGGHAGVPCQRCHASGQFAGLSRVCADCHSDPAFHAGLFGLNCVQCHTVENWSAKYNGPHPGIADEGGRGIHHGGASCRDCHTQTLFTATCSKCHDGNSDGGGHDD